MLLARMGPVPLAVGEVVDDVHRARQQAQDDERDRELQRRPEIAVSGEGEQLTVEDQRSKDERVFRPLPWTHRLEESSEHCGAADDVVPLAQSKAAGRTMAVAPLGQPLAVAPVGHLRRGLLPRALNSPGA